MTATTIESRGDLAERLLVTATHLACLVHGDGGPQDVADTLDALTADETRALVVVLAGLVDPETPIRDALGYLDWDEHGRPADPPRQEGTLRDIADGAVVDAGPVEVDEEVVDRFLHGHRMTLTREEHLAVIVEGLRRGLDYEQLDDLFGNRRGAAQRYLMRARAEARREGRESPAVRPATERKLTPEQVAEARERAVAGEDELRLALEYGVVRQTLREMLAGRTYRDCGGPLLAERATAPRTDGYYQTAA